LAVAQASRTPVNAILTSVLFIAKWAVGVLGKNAR